MPNSYNFYKEEVKEWFINNVPTSKRILDVGPGIGTYSILLRDLGYRMDALEIWTPYIDEFSLKSKYDNVYIGDIVKFDIRDYNFIILGDVLEHIQIQDAQVLIQSIHDSGKECLVAIPYTMEQDGEEYGNIYETHLQADLTHELMQERYPSLSVIFKNQYYGYYIIYKEKTERAYVLYSTSSYLETVTACVNSLNKFSDVPVYVYTVNFHANIKGAKTIYWACEANGENRNAYINRLDSNIYHLLIQRPLIVKDALKYANTVVYIDSDSVATPYIDNMFSYLPKDSTHPYFVEGIYDYLHINGRGGAESKADLSTTLEHPACILFDVDQTIRERYRQTGYFIANIKCISFLDEWWWMCNHPEVLNNPQYYAPYHEETIVNILLWKKNILDGLPYIYVNGTLETIHKVYKQIGFTGQDNYISSWFKIPASEERLLLFHGEKKNTTMYNMISNLEETVNKKLKVLFLAPHLSTGGMPSFLLKRIQEIKDQVNIYVVEYQCNSLDFVVQRNAIKDVVKSNFTTLYENKMELFDVINTWKPDIIHLDEPAERYDGAMISKLYDSNRLYKIVETFHDVAFKPEEKRFYSEAYAFCTPYHLNKFTNLKGFIKVLEFPLEDKIPSIVEKIDAKVKLEFDINKVNVLNVGLWTPGKNQAEGIEIAKNHPHMNFYFVGNQAGNFKHYWEPLMEFLPKNVHVLGEKNNVQDYLMAADIFMFNSTWECNPLVLREAISYGLPVIARNLPQYEDMFTKYISPIDSDLDAINDEWKNGIVVYDIPNNTFKEEYIDFYDHVASLPISLNKVTITQHFIVNPFLEITGMSDSDFKVEFYDEQEICHYSDVIKSNCWVKLNKSYYIKWHIKVWQDDVLIYDYVLDYTDKTVFIYFDSESLGDTIAWMPYCMEFKKKHRCHVVVSTYKNFLFEKAYPELEFVAPGTSVNAYGEYIIGWKYNKDQEPELCNTIPLQKTASNILGLPYREIKPRFTYTPVEFEDKTKYVTIATNSTTGCKFWIREEWQELINYLVEKGYKVYNTSKERNPFDRCVQIEDVSMDNTINMIWNSEFFIGLSSGLSWLAWMMGKQVVMISNFTKADHEFQSNCIRITNENVCHGCWNNKNFKFDKGNWNWCPVWNGYDRQFECHKAITADMVISKIKQVM